MNIYGKISEKTEKNLKEISKIAGCRKFGEAALAAGFIELDEAGKVLITIIPDSIGYTKRKREADAGRQRRHRQCHRDSHRDPVYTSTLTETYTEWGESSQSTYEGESRQTEADGQTPAPSFFEVMECMRGAGLPEAEAKKCATCFCEKNAQRWNRLTNWQRAAQGYADKWSANLTPQTSTASTGDFEGQGNAAQDDAAFRAWCDSLMKAHPALKECACPPPSVEKAARAAYASLPNAHTHAPMLAEYYADRLQEDRNGKKFWRPEGGEQFFTCLADIIAHAHRWQKEKKGGRKKRKDCNDPADYASAEWKSEPACTEEERRAFFDDMKRELGMEVEP